MGTTTTEKITFRPMVEADIPWVRKLDTESFADAWSEATWQEEVASTLAYYLVLEKEYLPLGYAGLWFVAREGQVTRVAVRPELRGQGLGKVLTQALVEKARALGANNMMLEVRSSNIPAQKVYAQAGFKVLGVRPHYYQNNQEDAIIMALEF